MIKPKGKIIHTGFRPGLTVALEAQEINISAWCPDDRALKPPEQVHLILQVARIKYPILMRFKDPDTLGFLIEELNRYRSYVWPGAEPTKLEGQEPPAGP